VCGITPCTFPYKTKREKKMNKKPENASPAEHEKENKIVKVPAVKTKKTIEPTKETEKVETAVSTVEPVVTKTTDVEPVEKTVTVKETSPAGTPAVEKVDTTTAVPIDTEKAEKEAEQLAEQNRLAAESEQQTNKQLENLWANGKTQMLGETRPSQAQPSPSVTTDKTTNNKPQTAPQPSPLPINHEEHAIVPVQTDEKKEPTEKK